MTVGCGPVYLRGVEIKINEQIKRAFQYFILKYHQVVQSLIENNLFKVSMEGHYDTQLVSKIPL